MLVISSTNPTNADSVNQRDNMGECPIILYTFDEKRSQGHEVLTGRRCSRTGLQMIMKSANVAMWGIENSIDMLQGDITELA
jgi:hypothetical protein